MRPGSFVVRILIVLGVAAGVTIGISRVTSRSVVSYSATANLSVPRPEPLQRKDPEGIIDGARNPEKIPDRVAYTLLLRFLSNRKTEIEKNTARTYLRMIFGCELCPESSSTKQQRRASKENAEKLLALAEEFETQITPLDNDARVTRGVGLLNLNEGAKTKLKKLQAKKEDLVTQLMRTFPNRLGSEGAKKLHDFVTQSFKRKVKIHADKQAVTSAILN